MMRWGDQWPGAVLTVVTSVMVSNDGWWSHWSAVVPLSTIVSLDRLTVRLSRLEGARQMSIFVNMDPEQNLHKSIIQIMQCNVLQSAVLCYTDLAGAMTRVRVVLVSIISPYYHTIALSSQLRCVLLHSLHCCTTRRVWRYPACCCNVCISILHHIYTLAR